MGENNGSETDYENNSTINITYETIFELLRREKNRDELQKLSASFYNDIKNYLAEKNRIFLESSNESFSDSEKEKTQKQVSNTKKMITELFERREKKIIILSLNKVRTSSAITDTSAMLNDEKDFFNRLVDTFSDYRHFILNKMFLDKTTSSSRTVETGAEKSYKSEFQNETAHTKQMYEVSEKTEKKTDNASIIKKPTKTLKILSQIPKFMGKEYEVYGPFNPDDMASLPSDIADILIKKGRAEEIKTE